MITFTKYPLVILVLFLLGCATPQRYYLKGNLNKISIGQTKAAVLSLFPGESVPKGAPGMQMRAAKRTQTGVLLEVGEVLLTDGVTPTVSHWFMFENGLLVQWGRPEDWKVAAERYDIHFNPAPSVPLK